MTETDVRESRSCERFLLDPSLSGSFGGSGVEIIDLAWLGLRIEHASPVRPGTSGVISFRMVGSYEPVQVRAEVAWSRLSQKPSSDGKLLYLSGLRFQDRNASLEQALVELVRLDKARLEEDSLARKKSRSDAASGRPKGSPNVRVIRQHRRIDEDTLLLVKQAWTYMKHNPVQATKWYNRAKFSLKDSEDSPTLHHRDDVLAIWEYLERMISLETIDWILDNEHLV